MSDERLLLLSALTTAALAGGLAAMSSSTNTTPDVWYQIDWPRKLTEPEVRAVFHALASDRRSPLVVLEIAGDASSVRYRLGLAKSSAHEVVATFRSFVPDIEITLITSVSSTAPTKAWRLEASTTRRPLDAGATEAVSRSLLSVFGGLGRGEQLLIQFVLGPRLPAKAPRSRIRPAESWNDVLTQVASGNQQMDHAEWKALTEKQSTPGFQCAVRIGTSASPGRAHQTALSVLAAFRQAEAPGLRLRLQSERSAGAVLAASAPRHWQLLLNAHEMAALSGWPVGDGGYTELKRDHARNLRADRRIPSSGRVVGRGLGEEGARPLTLAPRDALQHLHIIGPTGVGKSTLMLGLIEQDMKAGRGLVVIDPKGDLVTDVLMRIPEARRNDVVVLDPSDESYPVGLNVMAAHGRPAELVADQVLAVFHGLYKDNWGPRLQDILHASLLTLAARPDATLCALPVLLSNPHYRSDVVANITDDIALRPFWRWFDQMNEGERSAAIAPVMNKLRAFLLRPRMRGVIGQRAPRFQMDDVFSKKRILLVSLQKGLLGPEGAALLGSLVVSSLWQSALGRVRGPSDQRSPVIAYIDEFQDYVHLPTDLGEALAQARGLGLGLTLAHQHLGQLSGSMQKDLLSNARSRVCFQLPAHDARVFADGHPEISPEDFMALGPYQAYTSLMIDGRSTRYASLTTLPASEKSSDAGAIREASRRTFGQPIAEVEAELAALVHGTSDAAQSVGRRRKS